MKGSIKSNPVFASRELKDIESWTGKLITPGVISKQTVSKPSSWQSSTWLVHNGNKGPTKFYSGGGGEGGGRDEVWDLETMFSQLAKRSSSVVVSG